MLSYYALTKYIADNCEENYPEASADDCATMESAFGIRLVFNDIVAIALNVYYTYVCRLYAQQIEPESIAARHYQSSAAVSQSAYPPEFPTTQQTTYQRVPNGPQP